MKLLKQLRWNARRSGTPRKRGVNERNVGFLVRFCAGSASARILIFVAMGALLARPESARACAACYGQSDSPLASGVTWGILSLLVVVMGVLASIVTFFVYINKKSAAVAISKTAVTNDIPLAAGPMTAHASRIT